MSDLRATFEQRFIPVPESGCWLWTGSTGSDGYGRFSCGFNATRPSAHRLAYQIYKGEVPDGMLVCHKCDTPMCVNPDHLFLGNTSDNAVDAFKKGRRRMDGEHHPHARAKRLRTAA